MEQSKKVKYWINIAEEDFSLATYLFAGEKFLYTGFMCHQAVEKSLKAVIARNCGDDEIPPKIHNLLVLADKAQIYTKISENQKVFISQLNPLNIEARYPEYKDEIAKTLSNQICKQIITETEELLCWIKKLLSDTPADMPMK